MPERGDRDRLEDNLEEAAFIANALNDIDAATFQSDETLQRAVLHALQTIGEASTGLSDQTRSGIPSVPWTQVHAMRNRIVHGYFGIDLEAVWLTAIHDVPKMVAPVREYLAAS